MAVECVALWYFDLPGGNCADWVSGTMSGLAVAFAAGSYAFSEIRLRRENAEREKAVARSVGIKLYRLMNDAYNNFRSLRPRDLPLDRDPFLLDFREVRPIVGLTFDTNLSLDAVEVDLITRAGDPDFLAELSIAVDRHRAAIEGLNEYKIRYESLHAMMPSPVSISGPVTSYNLTNEQTLRILPHMNSLNELLNQTAQNLRENVLHADKLARRYTPLMEKHLRVEKWLSFELAHLASSASPS